ncbi:hypothetical protein M7I_7806 [Glarea lozoyensis 74030]|uniref:Uncharacterized protein n=1 Tax=Glarea lozoyensis (strain ATCC 74030 / MF5533) TaxID=1104152 RepID=H0EYA7_GLAL7|nr:hypothetical protein M7I_7806 [Glarea lozoyensis 74030]
MPTIHKPILAAASIQMETRRAKIGATRPDDSIAGE